MTAAIKRERKSLKLNLKQNSDETGEVESRFATLGVVDKDGDFTMPGAFGEQDVRLTGWGHATFELPVGRGKIRESGKDALFNGAFFINTTPGLDTYRTVKQLEELAEWSYEYDVLDAEFGTMDGARIRYLKSLLVHGVSPVYLGSGIDTATLDVKQGCAICASRQENLAKLFSRLQKGEALTPQELKDLATQFGITVEIVPDTPPAEGADAGKTTDEQQSEEVLKAYLASQRHHALYPTGV